MLLFKKDRDFSFKCLKNKKIENEKETLVK